MCSHGAKRMLLILSKLTVRINVPPQQWGTETDGSVEGGLDLAGNRQKACKKISVLFAYSLRGKLFQSRDQA